MLRLGRGMVRYPGAAADAPAKPLRLWSYESNQFARLVRMHHGCQLYSTACNVVFASCSASANLVVCNYHRLMCLHKGAFQESLYLHILLHTLQKMHLLLTWQLWFPAEAQCAVPPACCELMLRT